MNLKTIKNHLLTGSFNKIGDYTYEAQIFYFDCGLQHLKLKII